MRKIANLFFWLPALLMAQNAVTEQITLYNDSIVLPGTLSYPQGKAPMPLAILVHGSGNVDRNGNQAPMVKANYLQVLADSLNAHGIAVYRYDKRTASPKNADRLEGILFKDFVADVQVAIRHFANDNRFNSLHLIGHSQGSLVAMLAMDNTIKTVTSIGGAGKRVDALIYEQVAQQDSTLATVARAHFKELQETGTIAQVNPLLIAIFAPQNQQFLRDWMTYDPLETIRHIKQPVLVLNGDMDQQVKVREAELLHRAGPTSTLRIIPGMNHVLKDLKTPEDNLKSYMDPNFPISGILISELATFIKRHG